MAAAVGSLMIRMTLSPAMTPASLVACRWASLNEPCQLLESEHPLGGVSAGRSTLQLVFEVIVVAGAGRRRSTRALVQLGDDWLHDVFEGLLLLLVLLGVSVLVIFEPLNSGVDGFFHFRLLVFGHLLAKCHGRSEQVHVELLELGPGEGLREVFAFEEGLDLDLDLVAGGERALRLLDFTTQFLNGPVVFPDVLALLLLVQFDEVLHHALVEVLASKMGVSVGGYHLEHAVVDGQKRHVEGTAAKIEYQHVLLSVTFVESVGDGGGGGLVDDTHDVEPGDDSGVFGGLPLGVVEVSGDGNDGMGDLLP
ncbi:hypothetical protein MSG28_000089 [Choristoneura fumiferana]|uniref:Uncharacterized protein n=1 Tax=Choristoneura fumiferana TaxID=7141 RepID=A0ACC0JZ79_CHOFU|nr:hypothetical protein MSG28_000089 [Choristoneura fumiferana]